MPDATTAHWIQLSRPLPPHGSRWQAKWYETVWVKVRFVKQTRLLVTLTHSRSKEQQLLSGLNWHKQLARMKRMLESHLLVVGMVKHWKVLLGWTLIGWRCWDPTEWKYTENPLQHNSSCDKIVIFYCWLTQGNYTPLIIYYTIKVVVIVISFNPASILDIRWKQFKHYFIPMFVCKVFLVEHNGMVIVGNIWRVCRALYACFIDYEPLKSIPSILW